MNRVASKPHPRSKTPRIVATLDLASEDQRRLHDLLHRFHSGRWPLFRCLGMRQINGVLCEAVEWLRVAKPSFGVVTWRSDGLGLSWRDAGSAQEAKVNLMRSAAKAASATVGIKNGIKV
ncbi:MAG: hypothetical protein JNJ46_10695 [Myxococcales bacterium]|nr:hypothetical protein [Myxococcales bacterium]